GGNACGRVFLQLREHPGVFGYLDVDDRRRSRVAAGVVVGDVAVERGCRGGTIGSVDDVVGRIGFDGVRSGCAIDVDVHRDAVRADIRCLVDDAGIAAGIEEHCGAVDQVVNFLDGDIAV